MSKKRDRLYVGKGDKELFDELAEKWILKDRNRRDQFLLAMAYGVARKKTRPFEKREEMFFLKDLRPQDEALLDAIALKARGSLEVLSDKEAVYTIAQEYAHAGVSLLVAELRKAALGSFEKRFELGLNEVLARLSNEANGQQSGP